MRKRWLPYLIVLLLILTTACGLFECPVGQAPPQQEENYLVSSLEREIAPQIDPDLVRALARGNVDFSMAFYARLKDCPENMIFSPLSLSLALSMTMAGAEGATEDAILSGLQIPIPEAQVHQAFNALLLAVNESQGTLFEETEASPFKLHIANSIWGQAGLDFKIDFLNTLGLHYGAGIHTIDFSADPDGARQLINDWIARETEQEIINMIPPSAIDALTRLVLANAIYFNGSWKTPFDEQATDEGFFHLVDGSEISVERMHLSGENLAYGYDEDYQIVRLPYASPDFSMVILFPDVGAFQAVESRLALPHADDPPPALWLDEIMLQMEVRPLTLTMPKFDFETELNAGQVLIDLGIGEAFQPGRADFSGITENADLFISQVLHKATIAVDEAGTEAAAATVVIMREMAAEPSETPLTLEINRPFIFFIQHEPTGVILFIGRVLRP